MQIASVFDLHRECRVCTVILVWPVRSKVRTEVLNYWLPVIFRDNTLRSIGQCPNYTITDIVVLTPTSLEPLSLNVTGA